MEIWDVARDESKTFLSVNNPSFQWLCKGCIVIGMLLSFNLIFDSFFFSSLPKGSVVIKSTCFSKSHIKEKTACHVAFQWQHAISVIIPVRTAGDLIISLKTWPQIPLEKIEWNTSSPTQKSRFPHSIFHPAYPHCLFLPAEHRLETERGSWGGTHKFGSIQRKNFP